jgi:ABC-2 type transport system ATP-binding protein
MSPSSARVAGLSKLFGDVAALNDVTLDIEAGEVHALLGANGAGKSTLMRCLLGYLAPTHGAVTVLDGDSRDPAIRARIGYLPGDLRLPARSSAAELLDFHAQLLARAGRPARQREELIQLFDVPVERRIGALSKGNRQKVGLVLALMADPRVIVLDEPTSGLDPIMQRRVHEVVQERRADGAAVLFSTHILTEAAAIADRVAVLSHGRLVADESHDTLLDAARQAIEVSLDHQPPADILDGLEGLVSARVDGRDVSATIIGSLADAMSRLAPYGVRRIATQSHELDAMFDQAAGDAT